MLQGRKGAEVKERGILFCADMVRAIQDGRKTMTRRVVKPQPKLIHAIYPDGSIETERLFTRGDQRIHCPFGEPGERLYVKETWFEDPNWPGVQERVVYQASGESPEYWTDTNATETATGKWRSSRYMPKWATRIWLEITAVRVERVWDISEEDAIAEGIECHCDVGQGEYDRCTDDAPTHFARLWESLHGEGAWERNDWVWVIEFRRMTRSEHARKDGDRSDNSRHHSDRDDAATA